ncbi:SapC family protein [Qipengyuania mesophila]|uniref:SapC family protein n=1 Tax=Erythrobacteraceae TaxID=335929 RepID=UPI0035122B7F
MASAPQQPQLPMFYQDLMPLNTRDHMNFRNRLTESAPWLTSQHMIPLTADEFVQAGRHFPIIFSSGENPLPLALLGLNEGVNTFFDDEGKLNEPVYVPAYIRRYPFLLARLSEENEELSLCFDPTCNAVGEFDEGEKLFNEDGSTTEQTKAILDFCEKFEQAGMRTKNMTDQLMQHDLLMDGEVSIERGDAPGQPYVYKGFRMIDQEKLRQMDGATLEKWNKDGMLPLLYAHLNSLDLMRMIFAKQEQQGKIPAPNAQPAG